MCVVFRPDAISTLTSLCPRTPVRPSISRAHLSHANLHRRVLMAVGERSAARNKSLDCLIIFSSARCPRFPLIYSLLFNRQNPSLIYWADRLRYCRRCWTMFLRNLPASRSLLPFFDFLLQIEIHHRSQERHEGSRDPRVRIVLPLVPESPFGPMNSRT